MMLLVLLGLLLASAGGNLDPSAAAASKIRGERSNSNSNNNKEVVKLGPNFHLQPPPHYQFSNDTGMTSNQTLRLFNMQYLNAFINEQVVHWIAPPMAFRRRQ